jgi:NTE family protein
MAPDEQTGAAPPEEPAPPVEPRGVAPAFDPSDPSVVTTPADRGPVAGMALCLSGGGSRAMLYHAGAILRLAEAGMLEKLDCVSSVSGGSITAGLLASCWPRGGTAPSPAVVRDQLIGPLLDLSSKFIDIPAFITGTLLPWSSPGRSLAGSLDRHLYRGFKLGQLPERPEFVINATNLGTGVLWRFSREFVGDYQVGGGPRPELKLAMAVAASSAFPPFFAPFRLGFGPRTPWPQRGNLPADRAREFRRRVDLGDGGIYDNLGLETAWKRFETVLVSDGGGTYKLDPDLRTDVIRLSIRVTQTIDHQVRSLRLRDLVENYKPVNKTTPPRRKGALWMIRTPYSKYPVRSAGIVAPEKRTDQLALVGTHMRGLKPHLARRLVNWGYAISDAALRSYMQDIPLDDPTLPFVADGI